MASDGRLRKAMHAAVCDADKKKQLNIDVAQKTLYHITTQNPNMIMRDGELILEPRQNKTIEGDVVNAVFASDELPSDNPYIARDWKEGMYGFGDIIIYNNDNINQENGCLTLKKPSYAYSFSGEGFEARVNGNEVEYINRNAISGDRLKVSEIHDVTSLCHKNQIFSDIHRHGIGYRINEILTQKDISQEVAIAEAKKYLQQELENGNLIYHNAYTGINVRDEYAVEHKKCETPIIREGIVLDESNYYRNFSNEFN